MRAVVIGAGFGGVAAAHHLRQAGITELTIVERASEVGGVWRDNTYPGCACDIPAPLYSFSFAQNPDWTRRFPPHTEILAYLRRCVRELGLTPHLRLDTEVIAAQWVAGEWRLHCADGSTLRCDLLVPAVGQLARPLVPQLPGSFAGPAMHTARWDAGVNLTGVRVGVIGTGASAVQLVPAIAGRAGHVTVFQRTPPWTLPKPDHRYGRLRRAANRRVPAVMRLARAGTWGLTVVTGLAVTGNPVARALVTGLSRAQRHLQAGRLRPYITPDYAMGCKRVLFTHDWLPTLRRPDVTLVTAEIEGLVPTGVATADGVQHEVDVLIYGTGFRATEFLAPMRITGQDGTELSQVWGEGAFAYLGMAVPGFPNMFLMYGPNTNTGNTSVVYFHEAQARYIAQAAADVARHGPRTVRAGVAAAFDEEIQHRLRDSVWTGCHNWYRTDSGRVVANWPGMASEYRRRTARYDPTDYEPVAGRSVVAG